MVKIGKKKSFETKKWLIGEKFLFLRVNFAKNFGVFKFFLNLY